MAKPRKKMKKKVQSLIYSRSVIIWMNMKFNLLSALNFNSFDNKCSNKNNKVLYIVVKVVGKKEKLSVSL